MHEPACVPLIMPLHIEPRGGRHCLVNPNGESEYCHDTYDGALAQLRAINANKEVGGEPSVRAVLESRIHYAFTLAADQLFSLGYMDRDQRIELSGLISDVLTSFGDSIDQEISDVAVMHEDAQLVAQTKEANSMGAKNSSAETTDAVTTGTPAIELGTMTTTAPNNTTNWFVYGNEQKKKGADDEKKFAGYWATSFEELDAAREAEEKRQKAITLISDFMSLSANAMEFSEDPVKAIEDLAGELVIRLRESKDDVGNAGAGDMADEEMMSDEEKQVGMPEVGKNGFMVWKQDDGSYRWLGVYSNKFRDDDRPVKEIISEKAHKEFIGRVNAGEIEHPDLYVWHIPMPVGKSDLLVYDDSGFSVVSGTFTNKSVAEALLITSEDLAMSHGMPAEFIQRSKDDNSVITRYVSTEVSVLPRRVAANKRTSFSVLNAKEDQMAIEPELRGKVVDMIGEDATASIEQGLQAVAKEAVDSGVDFKAEGEVSTDADTSEVEIELEVEVEEEVIEEVEEVVEEEATEEQPAQKGDGETADPMLELKQEIAGLIVQLVKNVEESNEAILGRIEALEQKQAEAQQSKEESKEAEAQPETPASLAAMLASQLAGSKAQSVIGKSATQVHGNSTLAKDAPEQNVGEEKRKEGGLFFQKWTN